MYPLIAKENTFLTYISQNMNNGSLRNVYFVFCFLQQNWKINKLINLGTQTTSIEDHFFTKKKFFLWKKKKAKTHFSPKCLEKSLAQSKVDPSSEYKTLTKNNVHRRTLQRKPLLSNCYMFNLHKNVLVPLQNLNIELKFILLGGKHTSRVEEKWINYINTSSP